VVRLGESDQQAKRSALRQTSSSLISITGCAVVAAAVCSASVDHREQVRGIMDRRAYLSDNMLVLKLLLSGRVNTGEFVNIC
jgi:hypothetical protein